MTAMQFGTSYFHSKRCTCQSFLKMHTKPFKLGTPKKGEQITRSKLGRSGEKRNMLQRWPKVKSKNNSVIFGFLFNRLIEEKLK